MLKSSLKKNHTKAFNVVSKVLAYRHRIKADDYINVYCLFYISLIIIYKYISIVFIFNLYVIKEFLL